MAITPGTVIGGYRIERILGAGGMGSVYLAKHPSLPRMDALKVLSSELSRDAEFRARFEREANLAAGLDHPNIVSVFNRGEEHGQLWIAMQYIEGTDASAEMTRDPYSMNPLRALRIVTEVGKGLDYAHRKGLLHRDVKPANFLLSAPVAGEDERILLTDFGVAKSNDDASELTQTGSFLATIAYAPPEQLAGGALDHRADIYSLACSFFKLLTGRNPYPATQPAMVMMGHLHEPPPTATSVNPGLPPAIDGVFARALAKNPAERFASCREFTDAAAAVLLPGHNPVSTNTSPTYPVQVLDQGPHNQFGPISTTGPRSTVTPPPVNSATRHAAKGRSRLLIAGAAAAVVAVAAAVGIFAMSGGDAPTGGAASSTVAQKPIDRARAANPGFAGKSVAMVDITDGTSLDPNIAVYLSPTLQTTFLSDLGLVYNPMFAKAADEPSPRAVSKDDRYTIFSKFKSTNYIIAIRTDEKAGGGGHLGMPGSIASSEATVIVVDDPATVTAIRNWTDKSEQQLVDHLVPLLSKQIK
ncbi:serine/threonine-protein kinase [Nocardia asteroides]|uniref:serine/threonine-protein kinase n=1 Tax=Nocardia asteroides TaxID=1824 RepID=UPI001E57E976|nr:serine/threonine-protein kinase [Nocardia asteroides]UGT53530.1 serine/threonine protein kinase [Nocardia asteroides]